MATSTKCIFRVDGDVKYPNDLTVLNEAGYLLPGSNLVIGPCGGASGEIGERTVSDVERTSADVVELTDVKGVSTDDFFSGYRPLDQIYERLNHVCQTSGVCTATALEPHTVNGNTLMRYDIGTGQRRLLVTSGLHAREWLATAVGSYLVNKLIDEGGIPGYTITIVPVANPDGYRYTYQSPQNRYWRKNMNGVDINRNWDVGFAKSKPTSDTYGGESPFTENETRAIKNVIDTNNFDIHLDIHSYSQIVAASWSYTEEPHPRDAEFDATFRAMNLPTYTYGHGSVNNMLGLAGGTVQDYSSNNGSLGFTVELPPKTGGLSGFSVPASHIIPVGNDMFAALKGISAGAVDTEQKNAAFSFSASIFLTPIALIVVVFLLARYLQKRYRAV